MRASIAKICDPRYHSIEGAIQQARLSTHESSRFELNLIRFLQTQCMERHVDLPVVFQGLEVLGRIANEGRLAAVLRPFLRSRNRLVASKAVLIAGRQSHSLPWLINALNDRDDRVRANLIESLWRRPEPEAEWLLKCALKDRNHRVAANAVYGLYLLGSHSWLEGLESLLGSPNPQFRRSAAWVIRMTEQSEAAMRLKPLIRDSDSHVRHAAFRALVILRERRGA